MHVYVDDHIDVDDDVYVDAPRARERGRLFPMAIRKNLDSEVGGMDPGIIWLSFSKTGKQGKDK